MTRIPVNLPGTQHVIHVAEDQVDNYIALGWRKMRVRHSNTDTGTTPTQRNDR